MTVWKRLLVAAASLRWLARRACRHMIKIRIETTIHQVVRPMPAVVPVMPPITPMSPTAAPPIAWKEPKDHCLVCLRARPIPGHRVCIICSECLPKSITKDLGLPDSLEKARPKIHALMDAAPNN